MSAGTTTTTRTRVVVTGADGFLGWHTRVRLHAETDAQVTPIGRKALAGAALEDAVRDADVVFHLAGINRAPDDEVEHGNIAIAERLRDALTTTGSRAAVIYADSIQAQADSPYGRGKRRAGEVLHGWADTQGTQVADVRLPGLFGEHGRPDYNSFVATFAHRIAADQPVEVSGDREIPLLYVQDGVAVLVDAWHSKLAGVVTPEAPLLRISDIRDRLAGFRDVYRSGEIPALSDGTDVALFNTLRAAMFPSAYPFRPEPRSDQRGTLVESVRVHGGQGQTFVSSTRPGFVRGQHFHLHKIERFQVLSGIGLIRLRKVLTDDYVEFPVSGERPAVVDMPTMWTHSIENTGTDDLVTLFWTNELFDPEAPDTYPEPVKMPDEPDGAR